MVMQTTTQTVSEETTPTPEPVPGDEPVPTTEPTPGTEPTEPPVSPPEPETEPGTPEPVEEPGEPQEPAEEPTEPTEPPLGAILSEKEMESAFRKLEAESTRHANRISEILGEDAQALLRCELCRPDIAGFRFNVEPTDDVKAAVRAAIGLPTLDNLKTATYARTCDKCDGQGKVLSGSRVQSQEVIVCFDCKGKGFLPVGPELSMEPPLVQEAREALTLAPPIEDGIPRDQFGTPEGDPDYQKMPAYRVRDISYWQQNQGQS